MSKYNERVYAVRMAVIHQCYLDKVERKGHTRAEVDEVIRWLTGYDQAGLESALAADTDVRTFFASAPALNPHRSLITGSICGVKIAEIDEDLMREIRYMDKLVDEIARGKAMEKILRTPQAS